MSGHSKWSTIKRKKAANDAKRGAIFTRLAREITIAAKQGGGDPDTNFGLRLAVDRAKAQNMPKDNIERAIKRGTGELDDGSEIVEVIYEAYATNGIGVLIECATDNTNRTIAGIKSTLNKAGGNMAEPGSVKWQFEQKGYISLPSTYDFDEIFMVVADAGAEDVTESPDLVEVFTPRESLKLVTDALTENDIKFDDVSLDWIPNAEIELDENATIKVMNLIEQLEDLDDTQRVFSNLAISDDIMASLAS